MTITTKENANGKISAYYVDGAKVRKNEVEGLLEYAYLKDEVITIDYYVAQNFKTLISGRYAMKVVFAGMGKNLMTEAAAEHLGYKITGKFSGSIHGVYRVEKIAANNVETGNGNTPADNTQEAENAPAEIDASEYAIISEEAFNTATLAEIAMANGTGTFDKVKGLCKAMLAHDFGSYRNGEVHATCELILRMISTIEEDKLDGFESWSGGAFANDYEFEWAIPMSILGDTLEYKGVDKTAHLYAVWQRDLNGYSYNWRGLAHFINRVMTDTDISRHFKYFANENHADINDYLVPIFDNNVESGNGNEPAEDTEENVEDSAEEDSDEKNSVWELIPDVSELNDVEISDDSTEVKTAEDTEETSADFAMVTKTLRLNQYRGKLLTQKESDDMAKKISAEWQYHKSDDDTDETVWNLIPTCDELNDVEISDDSTEVKTAEASEQAEPAEDFAAKLADLKAAADNAKRALAKAQADCNKANADLKNFIDEQAYNLKQKLDNLSLASITLKTENGATYRVKNFDDIYIGAYRPGFDVEFHFEFWNGKTIARYETPAQVEAVIARLKEAIARGDEQFTFPTIDDLKQPTFEIVPDAEWSGISGDHFYRIGEEYLVFDKAGRFVEVFNKKLGGYYTRKGEFLYKNKSDNNPDAIWEGNRHKCDEKLFFRIMALRADDSLEESPDAVQVANDYQQTANSLTRAMEIALLKFQDFCKVGNLTAANREMACYQICRNAFKEVI